MKQFQPRHTYEDVIWKSAIVIFIWIFITKKILTCLNHLIWGKPMDHPHLLHKHLYSLHLCDVYKIWNIWKNIWKLVMINQSYPAQLKLSCNLKFGPRIILPSLFLATLSCCWHFSLSTIGSLICFINVWVLWSSKFFLPQPVAMQFSLNWPA